MVTQPISCPTKNGQLDQLWAGVCPMVAKTSKMLTGRQAALCKQEERRKDSQKYQASCKRAERSEAVVRYKRESSAMWSKQASPYLCLLVS